MKRPECLSDLVRLGYTEEEAAFLYVVATHSGYFTHRQFLEFSGTKPGKRSQKFLAKLLAQKHATFHVYQSGGRVYHLFSRKVFRAIGREDLRTRRRHQLDYIKTRLLTLNFVLSHLDADYLETEAEKVPFFENVMKIGRELLPAKVYSSQRSGSHTTRYFVDRFPLFIKDPASSVPTVVFTYVDAEFATLKGFGTHLDAYRALFQALPRFEFIYLSLSMKPFAEATSEFCRRVSGPLGGGSSEELLAYFRLRKAWETGQRLAAAAVVVLNSARRRFSEASFETLYGKWSEGSVKDDEVCVSRMSTAPRISVKFAVRQCGDSLAVFSRRTEHAGESTVEFAEQAFSPSFSPQVSHL